MASALSGCQDEQGLCGGKYHCWISSLKIKSHNFVELQTKAIKEIRTASTLHQTQYSPVDLMLYQWAPS